MQLTDQEIVNHLISLGYYGKIGMEKAAKVYAKRLEESAKQTALTNAKQAQIEALKVDQTLLNERLSRDILADIVKQSETLPTLQECADFIGMRFTSVNILPLSHKMALRYGIREMKRAKANGETL